MRAGDSQTPGEARGGSPRWFDEEMPVELGLGHPLEYAIYLSPLALTMVFEFCPLRRRLSWICRDQRRDGPVARAVALG